MSSAKPTRAEHRDATFDAIKQTARRLLVADGADAVRLRAIARELGLTAPALYRYVGSHEELMDLVVTEIYDDLIGSIERAADQGGTKADGDQALRRLGMAAWTFRRWAHQHPREFGMVFANPIPAADSGLPVPPPGSPRYRFAAVFAAIFTDLWEQRPFRVPDETDLPATLVEELRRNTAELLPGLPVGARYVFLWCWSRIYGAVCLEVFGHLQWAVSDGERLYEQLMLELRDRITS
ncbi:TetR/AcrR family transcriptional regulator [Flindersiella endophytica]